MHAVVHTSLAPPLSSLVEYLWSLSDVPVHAREHVVPSGTLELVVNLHEDDFRICDRVDPERCRRFPGAMASGAYGRFFVIDTRAHASIIGAHFRPGGALSFLGAPPGALADTHVDLATLLDEVHLQQILAKYFQYYNETRCHLSLAGDAPEPRGVQGPELGEVVEFPEVGGLHHRYERAAA